MKKSDINNRKSIGLQKPGVIIPATAALIDMPEGYAKICASVDRERNSAMHRCTNSVAQQFNASGKDGVALNFYWELGADVVQRRSAIGQQLVALFENESRQHAGKFVKQDISQIMIQLLFIDQVFVVL